jgi:hypothetical protein
MMAKLGEGDTAWIAADPAAALAEASGDALVAASMYRMALVFLSLDQVGQAQQVAAATAAALEPRTKTSDSTPEAQSLYGACELVLAIAAARDNERTTALPSPRPCLRRRPKVGEGRDDYGTEFGPINVGVHAVSVAVDLGDARHALEFARDVNYQILSPEPRARHMIDLAAAHALRRQIGEAIDDLHKPSSSRANSHTPTTARDSSPATCSNFPACGRGPNYATSLSDSQSCHGRHHRRLPPPPDCKPPRENIRMFLADNHPYPLRPAGKVQQAVDLGHPRPSRGCPSLS